jgi:hypothetical protein
LILVLIAEPNPFFLDLTRKFSQGQIERKAAEAAGGDLELYPSPGVTRAFRLGAGTGFTGRAGIDPYSRHGLLPSFDSQSMLGLFTP